MIVMQEHSVSITKVSAVLTALVGCALVTYNAFESPTHDHVGFLAVPFLAASVVLWVRSYFVSASLDLERTQEMVKETQELIQDAYNVGREVGRLEEKNGTLRPLR